MKTEFLNDIESKEPEYLESIKGGKKCTKCGKRFIDRSNYRGVEWCPACLDEHNSKEVEKMLDHLLS